MQRVVTRCCNASIQPSVSVDSQVAAHKIMKINIVIYNLHLASSDECTNKLSGFNERTKIAREIGCATFAMHQPKLIAQTLSSLKVFKRNPYNYYLANRVPDWLSQNNGRQSIPLTRVLHPHLMRIGIQLKHSRTVSDENLFSLNFQHERARTLQSFFLS